MEETRPKRKRKSNKSSGLSVVCTTADLAEQPGAIELGLILTVFVVALYFVGFYISVMSLPDTPKALLYHVGQNLNVANPHEWESPVDTKGGATTRDLEKKAAVPQRANKDNNNHKSNIVAPPAAHEQEPRQVTIPKAVWPVSIRNDADNFETLIHPGDHTTEMRVPRFWSGPVHQKKLMSRETALKIGSCIEPDSQGNYNRGDDCPLEKRTIYVGIASYRDFECRSTAESIFLRAKYPERIRIGVVDQIVEDEDAVCDEPIEPCDEHPEQGLCKYKDQIDVYKMPAQLSIGPVFARHVGYRMYRGEYYATQSDAHVTYTQDWDVDIVGQLESTHNEMAVLSTYLTDVQGSIDENGKSLRKTRPIMCNTYYEGGPQGMHLRHGSQPERQPFIHGSPMLQPWWAAGYSFSRGHFIVNVPYDWISQMIFQGEEMSIGIRGFTIGYDFYAPERSVCFHHYAVGKNAKVRNKVHHFWENSNAYAGTGKKAMQRLLGIVHMNPEVDPSEWDHTDEDIYGVGGVRTTDKFYETFGIHVKEKTVENHLCSFVDLRGKMHGDFTPHLRKDGMGIDYSAIKYQFKDPRPLEK